MTEAKPENEQASYDTPFVEPAGNPLDAPPAGTEPPEDEADDGSMSLIAHLTELRSRLIKCLVAVALGSCAGYYFLDEIMHYLTAPAGKLYYMQPSEAFFTYLKVSIAAGFLVALPVIFYQVWMFFLPALTRRERMVLGLIVPASVLLFFGGLAFSFFLVFPAAVQFFLGFGNTELEALFSVDKYFDFVIWFVLPFGFVFELPLIRLRAAAHHDHPRETRHRRLEVPRQIPAHRRLPRLRHRGCHHPDARRLHPDDDRCADDFAL